jgi:hypothetical protein
MPSRRKYPRLRLAIFCYFDAGLFMARKRKKKVFSAAKVLREMARERVGSPKPSRPVPAKTTKAEKHKPTLGKLLGEE